MDILWLRSLLVTTLLIGACTDEDVAPSTAGPDAGANGEQQCALDESDPATLQLAGACPQETHIGAIVLEVQESYSFIDARVSNAVVPSSIRDEEANVSGCRLMRKSFPFCDPACGSGETCSKDGQCVAYPILQDLGDLCVAGLSESYLLAAKSPGYQYSDTQIAHPAFAGGERVEVVSSGGAYPSFELRGVGVTTMSASDEQWNIKEGEDLPIRWATSDDNLHSSVAVSINIDQHGSAPLLLECDFDDSGQASVPAELIAKLLGSGVSGFPTGRIQRNTADSISVEDGCIDFTVRSAQKMAVRVADHTPCKQDAECPEGQSCNRPKETCE